MGLNVRTVGQSRDRPTGSKTESLGMSTFTYQETYRETAKEIEKGGKEDVRWTVYPESKGESFPNKRA